MPKATFHSPHKVLAVGPNVGVAVLKLCVFSGLIEAVTASSLRPPGVGGNEDYRLWLSVMALIIETRLRLSNCPRQNAICNLSQNLRVLHRDGLEQERDGTGCAAPSRSHPKFVFSNLIISIEKQQN